MHPWYFGIVIFLTVKTNNFLNIFEIRISNASQNHRLNVSIGIVYKKTGKIFLKSNENVLVFILEIFHDFRCGAGQHLFYTYSDIYCSVDPSTFL